MTRRAHDDECCFGDGDVASIINTITSQTTITTLDLRSSFLTPNGIARLAAGIAPNAITSIDLTASTILIGGHTQIASLILSSTALKVLKLAGLQLGDDGVDWIARTAIVHTTSLVACDLFGNALTKSA